MSSASAHAPLTPLLAACGGAPFPPLGDAEQQRLQQQHQHLQALLAAGVPVYGANSRPGHRDDEAQASAQGQWREVLASHAIGEGPWHSAAAVRCIGVAKLAMWRAGGSGVAPALFHHLAALLGDDDFKPQVPRGNSYSAGDVIPAAHWAQAVLQGSARSGPFAGEPQTMPLINGGFVHAGLALASMRPLRDAWVLFFENSVALAAVLRNNGWLRQGVGHLAPVAQPAARALRAATQRLSDAAGRQDPVSLRATDEVFETLLCALLGMADHLARALHRPSCNPLIDAGQASAVSQASFMLPALTAAQSALVEALLLAMWAQAGRVAHLLSGEVPGLPRDGASAAQPLGSIQHPKQMMAVLEEARMLAGRRAFASGGATSYGIEDLWSQGLNTTEILLAVGQRFARLGAIEALLLQRLAAAGLGPWATGQAGGAGREACSALLGAEAAAAAGRPQTPLVLCSALSAWLDANPQAPRHGFPVEV